ncbi:12175_t:CDS:2 [Funneliformis mosseae]|uniref:12175_t:CDS:1 n=1 Tax=Funneliformis mosseae TaxID=27381 RepID=A0A9N9FZ10_FUNMO|nr:12175_t:CDS:2 [Funneliformis mosseae]
MKLEEQKVQELLEYLINNPIFPPPIMNPKLFFDQSARQSQMIVTEFIISKTEFHLRKRATMEEMLVYQRLSEQVNERIKRR